MTDIVTFSLYHCSTLWFKVIHIALYENSQNFVRYFSLKFIHEEVRLTDLFKIPALKNEDLELKIQQNDCMTNIFSTTHSI